MSRSMLDGYCVMLWKVTIQSSMQISHLAVRILYIDGKMS